MSISNFEQLCAGFCDIAKVATPALQAEQDGILAFNVDWRGVTVDVMYQASRSGHQALIFFGMGPIERVQHQPEQILLALLKANFLSLQGSLPTFSCHPETGDAVLQSVFPLAESSAEGLFKFIEEGVNLALTWRKTFFLNDEEGERFGAEVQAPTDGFA